MHSFRQVNTDEIVNYRELINYIYYFKFGIIALTSLSKFIPVKKLSLYEMIIVYSFIIRVEVFTGSQMTDNRRTVGKMSEIEIYF